MSNVLDLVRPDLRDFAGYASARRESVTGKVWLNANESPLPSPADPGLALHRYPEPQPAALRNRLAELYGVAPERLMVTRGSDEGIDLLVRAFCRAGVDKVMVLPPCFGMYSVCARVQNAPLVEVPLKEIDGAWTPDLPAMLKATAKRDVRVVFLCSPANPTGQALSLHQIQALAQATEGRAVLVVDEAYAEYSAVASATGLLDQYPHLVVLRTLSKAYALAGARIGAVLADAGVIRVLRNLQAPYPLAAPSAAVALAALAPAAVAEARRRVQVAIRERDDLARTLARVEGVLRVYASEANFLLVRFADAEAAYRQLLRNGVVVRDVRAMPRLGDALRISVGTPDENLALLKALQKRAAA